MLFSKHAEIAADETKTPSSLVEHRCIARIGPLKCEGGDALFRIKKYTKDYNS